MRPNLHANATTTPKTRAYIQARTAPVAEVAAELGVSGKTVLRWANQHRGARGTPSGVPRLEPYFAAAFAGSFTFGMVANSTL